LDRLSTHLQTNIERARQLLGQTRYLLITAGAGMGVDSGLPDFRGPEGFWRAYPVARRLGLRFEELANPRWFEENPKLAWGFYGHRLNLYRRTTPHRGFELLLQLPHDKFVFTSNVDGQFQKAGFSEEKIVEIHGSIHYLQCTLPCCDQIWENREEVEVDEERLEALNLPRCRFCGEVARPNILMFGDWKFIPDRVDAQLERFEEWLGRIGSGELAIIEIGAGTAVPTVRNLSERIARRFNTPLIRINPRDYHNCEIPIPLPAKKGLELIISPLLKEGKGERGKNFRERSGL